MEGTTSLVMEALEPEFGETNKVCLDQNASSLSHVVNLSQFTESNRHIFGKANVVTDTLLRFL